MNEEPASYNGAPWPEEPQVRRSWMEAPKWNAKFVPFGDRLNFLSPESRQCASGRMRILPPRGFKKRK